jgi:transposase InsO family protein
MCELLEVSRSGYYKWAKGEMSEGEKRRRELKILVKHFWLKSKKRFGVRRIHDDLVEAGYRVSKYLVARLMRELGIRGIQPNKPKRTTVPAKDAKYRPDLIKRDFLSPVPGIKLVGDITYLKTDEGFLYLATVIDLYSRKVIGWAIDTHMKTSLVLRALEMALQSGIVAKGAIFHSDRGSQYSSLAFAYFAQANDIRLSVGRTGTSTDNAVAESFFSSLKNEMYNHKRFSTKDQARNAVFEYIEIDYNKNRKHSTLDYLTPQQKLDRAWSSVENVEAMPLRKAA